jgi:predicted PurR-regulated permease PerM
MMEPRVVGRSIGLHPLVTLMSMYVGSKMLGLVGLILGPVVLIAIKTFQKAGFIPKFKE